MRQLVAQFTMVTFDVVVVDDDDDEIDKQSVQIGLREMVGGTPFGGFLKLQLDKPQSCCGTSVIE